MSGSPSAAVERFLALSRTRLAPRTVESYRRDLEHFGRWLGESGPEAADREAIERYLAELRADGLAGSTIARRLAALRSFYRHEQLIGARLDNPAAEIPAPRRVRRLPRTLSASEAERLIEAAAGTTPRALRDAALVELLYGAGLRVTEAVGLDAPRSTSTSDSSFASARAARSASSRSAAGGGRRAAIPVTRASVPRPPAPPRALLEREGRAADPRRRLPPPAPARREGRSRARLASTRISSATRSRRTCSRAAPTSAASRRCSGTQISPRPSSTPTSRTSAGARRTSQPIPTPGVERIG